MIANRVIGGNGGETASIFVTGLSETDTVTATKGGKTYVGKWTTQPNPASHELPSGYTELEYIESTGTQYIDTEIKSLSTNLRFDFEVEYSNVSSETCLFGTWGSTYGYLCGTYGGKFDVIYHKDSSTNYYRFSTLPVENGYKYTVNLNLQSDTVTINEGSTQLTNHIYAVNDKNILLFNNGNVSESIRLISCKLYHWRMIRDDIVVRYLIPTKRYSDGAIGMYDLISNTFFANSGTGSFVAGSEIPSTINGHLIDGLKEYGTYTVTATDGKNTITQDVLVDVATQYDIQMTLSGTLYLYNLGDECEDVTGGWQQTSDYGANSGSFVKNSDNIQLNTVALSGMNMGSSKKISRGSYTKLCIELSQTSASNSKSMFGYGPTNYRTKDDDNAGRCNCDDSVPPLLLTAYNREVFSLDLTLDEFYVWFGSNYASEAMTHNFYKVWLE